MLMFWPSGFVFFWAVTDTHTPILSLTYMGFLLFCILQNTVTYSVIGWISYGCLKTAKIAILIPALAVLVYWQFVIRLLL
jgi:hypothetical protein